MSRRWEDPAGLVAFAPLTPLDRLRIGLRLVPLVPLVFGGLFLLLMLRLVERPLWGAHRPLTPHITQFVCRNALRLLGLRLLTAGQPMSHPGAMVANHSSWLDIFVLNAAARIYFVSKAEVAGWAGIGWLARATGTIFIERNRQQARAHKDLLAERMGQGHRLVFFPEGTSTNGRVVAPFRSTLFQAFLDRPETALWVQPVSLAYHAPAGTDRRFYGWWGAMGFGAHFWQVLAQRRPGQVMVTYHDPIAVADMPDRKALARTTQGIIETEVGRSLTLSPEAPRS